MSQTVPAQSKSFSLPLKLVLLAALITIIWSVWHFFIKKPEEEARQFNPWAGAVSVLTVPAAQQNLQVELKAIGTVIPLNSVVVRSQVSGVLNSILFKEGQQVQKGQLLALIAPAAFDVKLAQAQGEQQQNLAQLKNAETALARYQLLYKQDSIAKQQVEQQEALVNQLRGSIKADQAKVNDASLQQSYTRIVAPISGRLGLRRVDAGNLINAADTNGLVTITQTQPISVQFSIPENQVMAVRQAYQQNRKLLVKVWDRAEKQLLATGYLDTLDNQIDVSTGTLKLKAVFDNNNDVLFPNQFVNAQLFVSTIDQAITIPMDAVQYGVKGTYVYSVQDGKAVVKMLKLGVTANGQTQIVEGLKAGEPVVLEGIDRLFEGRDVRVVNQSISTPAIGKDNVQQAQH
jgi:multidrug efflux system membrane fusion protein